MYKGVDRWEESGVGGGGGGSQKQVIPSIKTQAVVLHVSSISDRNRHNPQDRPRQSLAAVWHHTHPYLMPFTGTTDLVMHPHSLTGSAKALCENRLGHL